MQSRRRRASTVPSSDEETGPPAGQQQARYSSPSEGNDSPVRDPDYVPPRQTSEEDSQEEQTTTTQKQASQGTSKASQRPSQASPSQTLATPSTTPPIQMAKQLKTRRRGPGRPVEEDVQVLMENYCFTLDNEALIESVHGRPPLWDNRSEEKKNRTLVNRLWLQVTRDVLGENFDVLSQYEIELMVREVRTRWRSLRDRFVKDHNDERKASSRSGSAPKKLRKHHLHERLRFLLPTVALRQTHSSTLASGGTLERQTSGERPGAPQQAQEDEAFSEATTGRLSATPPVGTPSYVQPRLTISRTRANRVDMTDIVQTTNKCLGTIEGSINRLHISVEKGFRQMALDNQRLHGEITRVFPGGDDHGQFIFNIMHSMRMVHPSLIEEGILRIHNVVNDLLGRSFAMKRHLPEPPRDLPPPPVPVDNVAPRSDTLGPHTIGWEHPRNMQGSYMQGSVQNASSDAYQRVQPAHSSAHQEPSYAELNVASQGVGSHAQGTVQSAHFSASTRQCSAQSPARLGSPFVDGNVVSHAYGTRAQGRGQSAHLGAEHQRSDLPPAHSESAHVGHHVPSQFYADRPVSLAEDIGNSGISLYGAPDRSHDDTVSGGPTLDFSLSDLPFSSTPHREPSYCLRTPKLDRKGT